MATPICRPTLDRSCVSSGVKRSTPGPATARAPRGRSPTPIGANTSPRVHSAAPDWASEVSSSATTQACPDRATACARVSGQLGFEADLGAVAVPGNGNERQVKDGAGDPAEDPDHDDTVIEDCEQRRRRSIQLDDADDGTVGLIAHRRIDLFQAGKS